MKKKEDDPERTENEEKKEEVGTMFAGFKVIFSDVEGDTNNQEAFVNNMADYLKPHFQKWLESREGSSEEQ